MLIGPQNLPANVSDVRARIGAAAARAGRSVDSVTIVAASKAQPLTAIEAAARAGIVHFGESYVQEALQKIESAPAGTVWHFIGQLQSNKTRAIAEQFAWVHSVDRLSLAQRLSAQRPFHAPPLEVCIQVNLAGESRKAGVAPGELAALAGAVAELPRIRLRGLMCLPPAETDPARQRHWFAALRELLRDLNVHCAGLDTLSMGMSDDFESAVLEGATHVRIGTALFGPRPPKAPAR